MLEEPMGSGCAIVPKNEHARKRANNDIFIENCLAVF